MTNKKYQIFISSTFDDLQDERRAALEAILITNNIPIGMESFVASSQEQFEHIKNCIESCDYYILIVGGRYGSQHPKLNLSYTELEFDYAKSLNKPILAFIRSDINKCRKKDSDLENISKFRTKVQQVIIEQLILLERYYDRLLFKCRMRKKINNEDKFVKFKFKKQAVEEDENYSSDTGL